MLQAAAARPVEVLRHLEEHQGPLQSLGVQRIGVFGSQARGEARAESDVDVLVEFRPGCKSFDAYFDLKSYLERLLGKKVDLVIKEALKRSLRDEILSGTVYATFR
jgi:predicted nucleotidyltransferase